MIETDIRMRYESRRVYRRFLNARASSGKPKYCILGGLRVTGEVLANDTPKRELDVPRWNATRCARMCFRMGAVYKLITLLSLSTIARQS